MMESKPHVLIFIDWFSPAYKAGGPIRSVDHLVSRLNGQFRFSIITSDSDYQDASPLKGIKPNQWIEYAQDVQVIYLPKRELSKKLILSCTKGLDVDKIYLNSLYSPYFTLWPLWIFRNRLKDVILATRGMLSAGSLGVKSTKKKIFITLLKSLGVYRKITFHATNEAERDDIRGNLSEQVTIKIAPNLSGKSKDVWQEKTKKKGELKSVFLGRIAPEKNLLFAINCLRNTSANIHLDIYGPLYDQQYWEKCQQAIAQLPDNTRVNYKGVVNSNEIPEIMNDYHCLLLPSTGENYGHAIVESFLSALPVVISDQTPWKNLQVINAGYALSLHSEQPFAEALEKFAAMNQEEYNVCSKAAFAYGMEIADDSTVLEQNASLFQ